MAGGGRRGPPSAAATGPAKAPTGGVASGVRGAAGAVGGVLGCLTLPERPHARNVQPVAAAAPKPANGVTATFGVLSRRRWRRRCRHRAAPSCDRGAARGGGGEATAAAVSDACGPCGAPACAVRAARRGVGISPKPPSKGQRSAVGVATTELPPPPLPQPLPPSRSVVLPVGGQTTTRRSCAAAATCSGHGAAVISATPVWT